MRARHLDRSPRAARAVARLSKRRRGTRRSAPIAWRCWASPTPPRCCGARPCGACARPKSWRNVRRALLGSERYPGTVFEETLQGRRQRPGAARRRAPLPRAGAARLAPAPPAAWRCSRRSIALPEIVELSRQLRSDPFADALLLADAACGAAPQSAPTPRRAAPLASCPSAPPKIRGCAACSAIGCAPKAGSTTPARPTPRSKSWSPTTLAPRLRSALAHAGAGRLDIAERLLTRVARTGGRSGDGDFGELARQLGRILAEATLSSTSAQAFAPKRPRACAAWRSSCRKPKPAPSCWCGPRRRAPELKVRLADERHRQVPARAGRRRAQPGPVPVPHQRARSRSARLLERLSVSGPSELAPSRPIRLRVDALRSAARTPQSPLVTRELTLPNDGKRWRSRPERSRIRAEVVERRASRRRRASGSGSARLGRRRP